MGKSLLHTLQVQKQHDSLFGCNGTDSLCIYISGPELPFLLQQSQMVTLSDGVMLIGGNEKIGHRYKKEFLKLKSVTSKWEIQNKQQLVMET